MNKIFILILWILSAFMSVFYSLQSRAAEKNLCIALFNENQNLLNIEGGAAPVNSAKIELLDFNELVQIVEKFGVMSPTELMAKLHQDPRADQLLSNYTLHPIPQGGQKGTALNPRAIMFTDNLLVTVTGCPAQTGADTIETIQTGPDKEFEFRSIVFPSEKNGLQKPEISVKNPKKCFSCHSGRPIWGGYRRWGRVYGFADDAITLRRQTVVADNPYEKGVSTGDPSEFENFNRYLEETAHSGLYQYLRPPEGSPVSPFAERKEDRVVFRPNLRLGQTINKMNLERIYTRLKSRPDYRLFRAVYLILGNENAMSRLADTERKFILQYLKKSGQRHLTKSTNRILVLLERAEIFPHDISLAFIPQFARREAESSVSFYNEEFEADYSDGSGEYFTGKLYSKLHQELKSPSDQKLIQEFRAVRRGTEN